MSGKKFQTDEVVKLEVLKWTKEMVGEFYEEDIKKLVPWLINCIELPDDYGKK